MTNHQPLAVKDLVWGKVEPYPWWPGKIIQIISQENTPIYKVSFFGDSSYSFLRKQHLIQFSVFDFDLNSSFPQNLKFQKAVKQANKLASDKKASSKFTESQSTTPELSQKPAKLIAKDLADLRVRADTDLHQQLFECQQTNHQIQVNDIFSTQITPDNVLVLIQSLSSAAQASSYSYSQRKQTISFKQKLKQTMLAKYNLLHCFKHPENNQASAKSVNKENVIIGKIDRRFKKEGLSKNKSNVNLQKDRIKCLLVNKIRSSLARHLGSTEAKIKSLAIYELIEQRSKDSSQNFIRAAVKLLRELKNMVVETGQDVVKFLAKNWQER